jgi:hypothetical protein
MDGPSTSTAPAPSVASGGPSALGRAGNVVTALLDLLAGIIISIVCINLLTRHVSSNPWMGGSISDWAFIAAACSFFTAPFAALFVAATVLLDDWTLYRIAPLQGILIPIVGLPGLIAVPLLGSVAFFLGGGLAVLLPWLVYRRVRAVHMRRGSAA